LQYDVGTILQDLESRHFASVDKVIGILDVDIFVPVFSHVYGEARQGGDAALMSLFRLRDGLPGADTMSAEVLERAAKIALHEVCHLYNLTHCEDNRCLMHFSGNIAELDRLSLGFCRYCAKYLREETHPS
jgi:archaemetzincin